MFINSVRCLLFVIFTISACQAQNVIHQLRTSGQTLSSKNTLFCGVPQNLTGSFDSQEPDSCLLQLSWDIPIDPTIDSCMWVGWDYGISPLAVGLIDGGTFEVAARFTPTSLQPYIGYSLSKIRVFFASDSCIVQLKVWTGENAGQLIRTQNVSSITANEWNEYQLDNPVLLNPGQEIWIGYQITHPKDIMAAVVDQGWAVPGFGDMIRLEGRPWEALSGDYGYNNNWNLECLLTNGSQAVDSNILRLPYQYRVYRNGYIIGTSETNSFIENNEGFENPCYQVKAEYGHCYSEFSNSFCMSCSLGEEENTSYNIGIFPNPASSHIALDLNANEIVNIVISELTGRQIASFDSHSIRPVVDISSFADGIYIVSIINTSGRIYVNKLVIRH